MNKQQNNLPTEIVEVAFKDLGNDIDLKIKIHGSQIDNFMPLSEKLLKNLIQNFTDLITHNPEIGEAHYFITPTTQKQS